MIVVLASTTAGIILITIASYVFWRIDRDDALTARLRTIPTIDALLVLVILGGWAAGGSLIIYAAQIMHSY